MSTPPTKPPRQICCWAIVIVSKRIQWIHWETISPTRKGSIAKYRAQFIDTAPVQESITHDLATKKIYPAKVAVGPMP